jgi:selenide,water dikinase
MAEASEVTFELNVHDIAYFDEAIAYAKMGLVPAGAYKNRGYSHMKVDFAKVEEHFVDLLYDPQTSGGLLLSVEEQYADAVWKRLKRKILIQKFALSEG